MSLAQRMARVGVNLAFFLLSCERSAFGALPADPTSRNPPGTRNGEWEISLRPQLTSVKDQGRRPTGAVFALVGLIEGFSGEDFSEQCLAFSSSVSDSAEVMQVVNSIQANGLYRERDCPYEQTRRERIPVLDALPVHRVSHPFKTTPFLSRDAIAWVKSALLASSAVVVSVSLIGKEQWEKGPFLKVPNAATIAYECGFLSGCAVHSVLVTGLNDTLQLVEFKNSWGEHWGDHGYGYFSYDYFLTFGTATLVSN